MGENLKSSRQITYLFVFSSHHKFYHEIILRLKKKKRKCLAGITLNQSGLQKNYSYSSDTFGS